MLMWPNYSIGQAEKDFNYLTIDNMTDDSHLSEDFKEMRKTLLEARDTIYDLHGFDAGIKRNQRYIFDLEFGLEFYKLIKSEVDNRDIYTDDKWMYLSINVIPDIIHPRWGLDPVRYYQMSRRIYLKQIWWYIHLGWSQDTKSTYEILKTNSTDTIQALVERPGLGYNIELYREIMKFYATIEDMPQNEKRALLRRVMVLNTARTKTTAPELVNGGIEGYVKKLFEDVM